MSMSALPQTFSAFSAIYTTRESEIRPRRRPLTGDGTVRTTIHGRSCLMSTRATFRSRPMMAAVVLGTALTALSADHVAAAEAPPHAVNNIGRYCTSCWRNARLPVDAWGD